MTGYFPITPPSSPALDIVKLDGLIPVSKEPYPLGSAFERAGETFCAYARSIITAGAHCGQAASGVEGQERVWNG